jgi:hypothetical protein
MTGSILGFQKKVNQLKTLETALGAAKRQAEEFTLKEAKATNAVSQIEALSETALKTSSKISETAAMAETIATQIKGSEQQTQASLATIAQSIKTANDGAAAIGVHASETEASTQRAKELLSESEALRSAYKSLEEGLKTLTTSTESALTASQNSQEARILSLEENTKTGIESLRSSTVEATEILKAETNAKIAAALATLQKAEEDRAAQSKAQLTRSTEAFNTAADSATEAYRARFTELDTKATQIIDDNGRELKRLTTHLDELEAIIHEKIQLATNFQLFHSFQTRQFAIRKSKRFWGWALASCVALSLAASGIVIWKLQSVDIHNAAFYIKLSISLPIIYAIAFCSLQYSRERRLEEEYAFKANISISLDPYRKLVAELVDTDNPSEREKYANFMIESINRVFTSPTPHSFDEKQSNDLATGIIKELGNIITPITKMIRR